MGPTKAAMMKTLDPVDPDFSEDDDEDIVSDGDHVEEAILDETEVADDDGEYDEAEEECEEDAGPERMPLDDVPAMPARFRTLKREKKKRTFDGSPLRSEPDDDSA